MLKFYVFKLLLVVAVSVGLLLFAPFVDAVIIIGLLIAVTLYTGMKDYEDYQQYKDSHGNW